MKIPSSFQKFQGYVVHGKLTEDLVGKPTGKSKSTTEKTSSYLADYILSSLMDSDVLRDAVVDTIWNNKNQTVLFVINDQIPERHLKHVVEFFKRLDVVDKVAFGKKKDPKTGEEKRVVKVQGSMQDVIEPTES